MRRCRKIFPLMIIIISLVFTASIPTVATDSKLNWGSRGTEVLKLQTQLNANGYYNGPINGIYGSKTYAAIKKYQRDKGLKVTGILDTATNAKLNPAPKPVKVKAIIASAATTTNKTVSRTSSQAAKTVTPSRGDRTMTMLATGYDPGPASNDQWAGVSYLGTPLRYGIVAVDPNVIPLGSQLYIEGYGPGYAADTGGAIKGNRIDLCFNSYQEAMDFGMKYVKVTILK